MTNVAETNIRTGSATAMNANAVVYYSNTGQSKRIAYYFANKLGYAPCDVHTLTNYVYDNLVFVFPVHCQSLPDTARKFLSCVKANNVALIATYGRMCHGNGLYEAQRKFSLNVVAAAYVPTKHTYLSEPEFDRLGELDCIVQKILAPSSIKIPKSYKNPFADFFSKRRSQIGVKLYKNDKCDGCGVCSRICDENAMVNGVPNGKCIRCLKCVELCPKGALEFRLRAPMKMYLKRKKRDKSAIYI